ncbi:MAG: YncE family protein [Acidobacteria bacterium]|nr:YncE family protein [Acidobacteriota bacterium]MBS1865812.1 YncE family protein [Acidobacteriota bacterium]
MRRLSILAIAFAMIAGAVSAQTPRESLLVLSKHDRTLAIVDPATLKVVAKMPVGDDPHEVIATADGKMAYVSNYGGGGAGALHTLAVIDLVNQKALAPIDLGALKGPHGLDFAEGKVWFTAEAAKVFGSVDPATGKVDFVLGSGQNRTHMIFVTQDLSRIFTSNIQSGTISVWEKVRPSLPSGPPQAQPTGGFPAEWTQFLVDVGAGSEGFDVSPDGKELWAANARAGTIAVVNIADKSVSRTINANVRGANRLKFTPDGKLVLVSSLGGADVTVLDTDLKEVVKRIPVGHGAAGIQMEPNGARAFVACTPDNYVAVIDLKTLAATGKIDAGGNPDGMAWAVLR